MSNEFSVTTLDALSVITLSEMRTGKIEMSLESFEGRDKDLGI